MRKVWHDDDQSMPFENIIRHATENEAQNHKLINSLQRELYELRESNKAAWDTYGSELCAGDMSGQEKAIERKIEALR